MQLEVYFEGNKKVYADFNGNTIKTDQPVRGGGDGTASSPFDLFLASIGTCAGIYLKGFCDSRGIDASNIRIIQTHTFNSHTHLIEKIELKAILPEDFPEKYKSAILAVMDQCAVKKHLANPPIITTTTNLN